MFHVKHLFSTLHQALFPNFRSDPYDLAMLLEQFEAVFGILRDFGRISTGFRHFKSVFQPK